MGILAIVFSGLAMLGGIGTFFQLMILQNASRLFASATSTSNEIFTKAAAAAPYALATTSITFLFSVVLLITGIGLVKRLAWARKLGIMWSIFAIIDQVVTLIALVAFINPQTSILPVFSDIVAVFSVLFVWLPFPIILWALLSKTSLAHDFAPSAVVNVSTPPPAV